MAGLFSRLLKPQKTAQRGYADDVLKEAIAQVNGNAYGVSVSPETSLKFSAVWAAVRLLSEIPASLPKSIIETKPDGSFINLNDDPVALLLDYPNPYMTGFDFHELMNASLQLQGNAVAVIYRDGSGIANKIIPVAWSGVKLKIKKDAIIYDINDETFGINKSFISGDVLHYKLFSSSGLIGRSPISYAKQNIGLALSAESYGMEFFQKGGNNKAVIETDQMFKSYTEYASWREKYDKEHSGYGNNHGVPILQPGMKYHQLTMSNEDAQFIATRQFQIGDIARWYNIPPHLIGDLSRATFTNIEHQDLQFIKYTLRGLIKRQEKEWEMKMFPASRRKAIDVKFNIDGLARGDMQARSGYIVAMVNAGVITPDEGRAIEGYSPAGANELRVPQNITGANPIKNQQ